MMYFAGSHSLYTPPIPSRAVSAPPPPMFVPATSYGPPTPVRAQVTPPTPPLSSIGTSPDQLLRGVIPFPPISVGPFSVPAGIAAAPPPSNLFPSEHPTPPQPFSIPAGIAAAPPPSNFFPSERPTSQQPFSVPAGIAAAPPPSNFFPTERPTPPQPFSIPAGIAAAPPPSNFLTFVSPPPIRAQSAPTGIKSAPPKELVLSPGSRIEIRDELGQYSHGNSTITPRLRRFLLCLAPAPSSWFPGQPPGDRLDYAMDRETPYIKSIKNARAPYSIAIYDYCFCRHPHGSSLPLRENVELIAIVDGLATLDTGVAVSGGAIFSEFFFSSSSTLVPDGFLHNLYGFNAFQLRLVPFCSVYVTQVKKLRLNEVAFVESTREVIEGASESSVRGIYPPPLKSTKIDCMVSSVDMRSCRYKPCTTFGGGVSFSDQNGTTVSEQGRLTLTNEGWESVIVKEGSYSYISPEGIPVSVSCIADEKGFRATGSHLPNVMLVKGR
uniref:Uncharacterized protein n=1 Tax=Timema tahoe TaxID=61484 RepID=A0A7R9IAV8_9NEOP|nr:unnamed protein product [Timema tahoe]